MTKNTPTPFECIVLAGGLGTRLRRVVPGLPKVLAPVAGKPFLDILLRSLVGRGCAALVLSVSYMAKMIMDRYGRYFEGIPVRYAKEDKPLGTGGAVRLALHACDAQTPLIVNGDTFADLDIAALQAQCKQNLPPLLAGTWCEDASRYGSLRIRNGRIIGFAEKGRKGPAWISIGCYCLPREALDAFAEGQVFSLEQDYLAPLAARAPIAFFAMKGLFIDIGMPEDYTRAQTILADQAGDVAEGTRHD